MAMTGSEFLARIKGLDSDIKKRNDAMVRAVLDGYFLPIEWYTVEYKTDAKDGSKWSVRYLVSGDCLRIGTYADNVLVSMSQEAQQQIADVLNCVLPTALIADLIFYNAHVKLDPKNQSWYKDGTMHKTSRMKEYSDLITAEIAKKVASDPSLGGKPGLIGNVGKDWINISQFPESHSCSGFGTVKDPGCNYGWYTKSSTLGRGGVTLKSLSQQGYKTIQGQGLCHDLNHADYSQTCRLVQRCVSVMKNSSAISGYGEYEYGAFGDFPENQWVQVNAEDVASNSLLYSLILPSGPIRPGGLLRHPKVRPVIQLCTDTNACDLKKAKTLQVRSESSRPVLPGASSAAGYCIAPGDLPPALPDRPSIVFPPGGADVVPSQPDSPGGPKPSPINPPVSKKDDMTFSEKMFFVLGPALIGYYLFKYLNKKIKIVR